jgi:hypothetical protein
VTIARWQHCISYTGSEVEEFLRGYLQEGGRSCLLVAGAGFDPRSSAIAELIAKATAGTSTRVRAIFIREHRPNPGGELVRLGNQHAEHLQRTIADSRIVDIEVLAENDRAVVGGQRVVAAMRGDLDLLNGITDVILDMSALSIGISFPLASYLSAASSQAGTNFHLMAASNPNFDEAIFSIPSDVVDPVRGFSGEIDYEEGADEPKIWLPHLAKNRASSLQQILVNLKGPVKICPVLPLSQSDPTSGDRLLAEYENELTDEWEVDPRDLVYAIEDDPLDLYRTISAIYRRTRSVFKDVIRPHLVLSPSGNKVLAIGALMAALEHGIAIRYVESVGYEVDWNKVEAVGSSASRLVHVWLQGDPYAEEPEPPESEVPARTEQRKPAA